MVHRPNDSQPEVNTGGDEGASSTRVTLGRAAFAPPTSFSTFSGGDGSALALSQGDSTQTAFNDGTGPGTGPGRALRKIEPQRDSAKTVSQLVSENAIVDARPPVDQTQVADRTRVTDASAKTPEVVVQYSSHTDAAPAQKPDFTVKADGTIVAHSDFEKHGGNVVIQVERPEGQLDPAQNQVQQESQARLLAYVNNRLRQDYPDAEKNGVTLKDDQGLVPDQLENALGMRNAAKLASDYSQETQRAVENMRRFNGAGNGSMSRETADNYFPQRDVPMQAGETSTAAAFKDTVAALFNADHQKPYETVRKQNNEYRVGRYGMSGRQISNWLASLDLGDPPDPKKIEELIKQGKLPKGFNAESLQKMQAMAKNMADGKAPSAEDMKLLPKELQETIATDLTKKMMTDAGGDPSVAALAWMQNKEVGQVTQADLQSQEGSQITDAAKKAYSLATARQMSEKGDTINYKDNGEGSALGISIAQRAERVANSIDTVGWCYKGVKRILDPAGIKLVGGLAKEAASQLANHPKVQEIPKDQIRPGDILVHQPAGYGRTKGQQYAGHIAVYLGNGKEASDHVQTLITGKGYGGTRAFRVMSA